MTENRIKRVFAYLRVSGKGQLDGDGFDRQLSIISEYCAKEGLVIGRVFKEPGVSGTIEAVDRPELGKAMSLCGGATDISVIVVERADRIARDLIVSELFYREARTLGIKIIEACSGTVLSELDGRDDDPTKKMIRQMLGVLSEWDKSSLVKRLRLARERIRRSGKKCEGRKPQPLPEKVRPWWSDIQQKYHVEDWSVGEICAHLNRKTKAHWPRSTVYYWLTQPHLRLEKAYARTLDHQQNEHYAGGIQVAPSGAGDEQPVEAPEGRREGAHEEGES